MKKRKALCIASMASNLDNFNRNNIEILQRLGYKVFLASNFCSTEDSNSQEKNLLFIEEMKEKGIEILQVDFTRQITNVKGQIRSYMQIKNILKQEFDLIHCHSPICSVITRLCARKYCKGNTKIIYTAHGFHFFKGASLINWVFYYPVEKICSYWTDVLITINKEDYIFALKKLRAKKTIYIPGVGIDITKIKPENQKAAIRTKLNLDPSSVIILSVGELNKNKNHEVVIKALGKLQKDNNLPENILYLICGIGEKEQKLKNLVEEYYVTNTVKLVGYCTNILDYYKAADIFVFPSYREGLSMSLMEAMASGLPVICSKIRGNVDLIDENLGGYFFDPSNVDTVAEAIIKISKHQTTDFGDYNKKKVISFSLDNVSTEMIKVYNDMIKE